MKILFVTQGYPPERVGGVEVYLKGLVRYLAKEHEVSVFSRGQIVGLGHRVRRDEKDEGATITRVGVDLRDHSEYRDVYRKPWLDELFRDYLAEVRPDAVHIQHLGGLSLGLVTASVDAGAPVVMTLSDHQPYCPLGQRIRNDKRVCKTINLDECLECLKPQTVGLSGRAAKLTSYLLGKQKGLEILRAMHADIAKTFDQVSAFITPSLSHLKKMVESGLPGERSRVIPYGLDLSLLDTVPSRPAGAPVRRFGYLGTLIPSKGVEDLILAFKRMKTPGCSLHIYGEAVPYHGIRDYQSRLIEMARSAEISFYGPYQPQTLNSVLSNIDALVMPSRWYESYGITIREAFRARRAVIAADIGGFSEAISDDGNGLKFPAGDVIELAETMDRLARDVGLAEKIAGAGGPVMSIPEHADALLSLYRECIEKPRRAGDPV